MIVAGLGCRQGTSGEVILTAIEAALAIHGLELGDITVLASGGIKAREKGLRDCASIIGLPLIVVDEDRLKAADAGSITRSPASIAATGLGSLSEAAALGAAGTGSVLLGPRHMLDGVTCALARVGGAP